jgi:hypothetical protein
MSERESSSSAGPFVPRRSGRNAALSLLRYVQAGTSLCWHSARKGCRVGNSAGRVIMSSTGPSFARRGMIYITAVLLALCACSRRAPTPIDTVKPSLSSPEIGTATLSWEPPRRNADGSAIANLAGYFIYYGRSPTNLNVTIKIPDPYATTYTVDRLGPGTYYFCIVAFTATGIRSSATPIVSKTIR